MANIYARHAGYDEIFSKNRAYREAGMTPLQALAPARFESPSILKKLNTTSRALAAQGFLEKRKVGRSNYYINTALYDILSGEALRDA